MTGTAAGSTHAGDLPQLVTVEERHATAEEMIE